MTATDTEHTARLPTHQQRLQRQSKWIRSSPIASVLLFGFIVGEIGLLLWQHFNAPNEADFRNALGTLTTKWDAKNEPLLVAPAWAEAWPRKLIGDRLTLNAVSLSNIDSSPTVWLLSVQGTTHDWLKHLTPIESHTFGAVRLFRYKNPSHATVVFDFFEQLAAATVSRQGPQSQDCAPNNRTRTNYKVRFACDANSNWNWVGQHLAEVNHRPYHCIYAHPVDRHRMVVTFPAVPAADKLVVYTGIDDFDNRKRATAPVKLGIHLGRDKVRTQLGSITHQNDWPWFRSEFRLPKSDDNITTAVSFEVTSDGAFARTFCFFAQAIKNSQPQP